MEKLSFEIEQLILHSVIIIFFVNLKLCVAVATHNFKLTKNEIICQSALQGFDHIFQ